MAAPNPQSQRLRRKQLTSGASLILQAEHGGGAGTEWQADLFVTADKRQLMAAKNSGLRSEYIGKPSASAGG